MDFRATEVEFGIGEWLTVVSGFLFAAHIIVTDRGNKVG